MRIFQVDAFTAVRFTGNPATVVLDADGQSDAVLQSIAREFAHAETAFVLRAGGTDHDVRVRFFNARKEAPFVGHATLAVHAVLLALGLRDTNPCRQSSGTGVLAVSTDGTQIAFRQSAPQLDAPLQLKTTLRVAEALRLPATQLHESFPARLARKGSTRLLVPVRDPRALDALAPNFDTLIALGRELGAEGFFAFSPGDEGARSTESRMFCPAIGITEDPVSGNAHAMLAAYLWEAGWFAGHDAAFTGMQGRQMHRPGEVQVRLDVSQGTFDGAFIGGRAVLVSAGTLTP